MRIDQTQREIKTNVTSDTHAFTIASSSKAFKILSSNLYTDRPLAIIRELSCNAADAHKAANNPEPFLIEAPNTLSPELRIRDYGTGIKHEDIFGIYTTYFGSTKSGDNTAIGGLGLGSKTPFSYTDTFTVASYVNGTKRTYTAYISEDGTPAIVCVLEEPTDEPNGLEVRMPVHNCDTRRFQEAIDKFVPRLNPMPKIKGMEPPKPYTYTINNDTFAIRHSDTNWRHHLPELLILMGPVPYPIDEDALPEHIREKFKTLLNTRGMEIKAEIGDLEIQPSREALSYDKRSLNKLENFLTNVQDKLLHFVNEQIQEAKNYHEACCIFYRLVHENYIKLPVRPTYKGREVHVAFHIPREIHRTKVTYSTPDWRLLRPRRTMSSLAAFEKAARRTLYLDQIKNIVIIDQKLSAPYRVKLLHNENTLENALLLHGPKRHIKRVLRYLGNPPVRKWSDLPNPPATDPTVHPASASTSIKHTKTKIKMVPQGGHGGVTKDVCIDLLSLDPQTFLWLSVTGQRHIYPETYKLKDRFEFTPNPISLANAIANSRLYPEIFNRDYEDPTNKTSAGTTIFLIPRAHKKLEKHLDPTQNIATKVQDTILKIVEDPNFHNVITPTGLPTYIENNLRELESLTEHHREQHPYSPTAHLVNELARITNLRKNPPKTDKNRRYLLSKLHTLLDNTPLKGIKLPQQKVDNALEDMLTAYKETHPVLATMVLNMDKYQRSVTIDQLTKDVTEYLEHKETIRCNNRHSS